MKLIDKLNIKVCVILFVVGTISLVNGQEITKRKVSSDSNRTHVYYLSSMLNVGAGGGFQLDMNYTFLNRYVVALGYLRNVQKPPDQPDDFDYGFKLIPFLTRDDPRRVTNNIHLSLGLAYWLNGNKTTRLNLSAGVSRSQIEEVVNWMESGTFLGFGDNYQWETEIKYSTDYIINPSLDFGINENIGLRFHYVAILNSRSIVDGIGLGIIWGCLK